MKYGPTVERWCVFEIRLQASVSFAKPFQEVRLQASFKKDGKRAKASGFYDGGTTWKVRFLPEEEGTYTFHLSSNHGEFNGLSGTFECTPAQEGNNGPVRINGTHFNYAGCYLVPSLRLLGH